MDCLYHYCASYQESPGSVSYSDGTLSRGAVIDTHEAYTLARRAIADFAGFPEPGVVILSLTLLKATP